MREKIEEFLKNLFSSWQVAKIYETQHPSFATSIDKTYKSLQEILATKGDLVIGILNEEIASGEDIFFELSKKTISSIEYLKNLEIERITFHNAVSKEELIGFISFLITPIEEIGLSPEEYLTSQSIKNIEVGKIKGSAQGSRGQIGDKKKETLLYYENCLDKLSQSLVNLADKDSVDSLGFKFVSGNIMENLIGNYQIFFDLIKTKGHDVTTFMHILNVSILAMYFSHKLGFSKDDCLDIGMAALLHDMGKIYITRKIIQKPGKLDKNEFDQIKSHTILGAEILLKYVDTLTILPVVVAFEHHLRYDLTGYPKLAFPRKLHVASMIVAICDEYDALTQKRSYKNDYPPELIYAIMTEGRGTRFSPELLDNFFKFMGVWPKGTVVELEDKRIAIVREINEDDIFSPKIEVVSGGPREIVDLKKGRGKIKCSLNPLNEGKRYLTYL